MHRITRLKISGCLLAMALNAAGCGSRGISLEALKNAEYHVVLAAGQATQSKPGSLQLTRSWEGDICRSKLTNAGSEPLAIKEIVLFTGSHGLSADTSLYGEGFTMLSQTGGTLGAPVDIGAYTDRDHYRIPQPAEGVTVYNLALLSPPGGDRLLLAFTSSRRFVGAFRFQGDQYSVVLDAENRIIEPGETWELEEFLFRSRGDRNDLLSSLAAQINRNHPSRKFDGIPMGWCSWLQFGPGVTFQNVAQTAQVLASQAPFLEYVQLDDGYQEKMGDWLDVRRGFGGGLKTLFQEVRKQGRTPGIWLAPFIAEAESSIFQQHPDWFMQDEQGKPLSSDRVTFGGWRHGPWYALDGTHPEVQNYLEQLFRTFHEELGVEYFKLDGTFWGAMHGGRFHDPKATRVEAYRRGMEAILRGAGDAFILAANHPLWPSLGLINGARSSMDIAKRWKSVHNTARETFLRGWQHGTLWLNDPDTLQTSMPGLSEDELRFHWSVIYASGGLLLTGDDVSSLAQPQWDVLHKLSPPTGVAAKFSGDDLQTGVIDLPGRRVYALFNWGEQPTDLTIELPEPRHLRDFWSGEDLGSQQGTYPVRGVPAHAARLIVASP